MDIRAESRQFRTPGVPPVVPTTRQTASTTTKVPRFGGTTSWEQYRHVFDAIVPSNGWDDATAALQLLSHLDMDAALPPVPSYIEDGSGGRVVGALWVARQIGGPWITV